jgi:hypothetical protein
MFQDTPAWREHVRKRMRTNAHLAIRHDAWRFMPPGSPRYVGKDVVNYFWPEQKSDAHSAQAEDIDQRRDLAAELTALLSPAKRARRDQVRARAPTAPLCRQIQSQPAA